MSNFLSRIFKPSKKSNRESYQPLEDFGQRAPPVRHKHDFDTGILKSSMRRRGTAPIYDDAFLSRPTAAYHCEPQPQRYRGPRSLPPGAFDDSPNASPSSSTDGGYGLEKSYHSEFIPSSQPSGSRRKSRKYRITPEFRPRNERHKYVMETGDSDSENAQRMNEEEMHNAMKQIQKYKSLLAEALTKSRQYKADKYVLQKSQQQNEHKIRQLEAEIAILSQEKHSLEAENASLKSMLYTAPMQPRYYPSAYHPQAYSYMTPPAGIRSQFNNTNTGSHMASGGGGGNANSFRPPPPPTGNVFGNEGCGEELAFMSATTTASNARLPGMPVNDELPDEVKNFRGVEESSPSRPPTNSNQSSFNISNGVGGSNSTGSSPPNNKTSEQTPVASQKKVSPKNENPKLVLFDQILSKQLNAQTPKSSKINKSNSTSCLNNE